MTNPIFHNTIKTARFILRPLRGTDDMQIFLLRSNLENAKYLDRPLTENIEQARMFIDKIVSAESSGDVFYRAIEQQETGIVAGNICYWNFSDDKSSAEIGFELLPEYQGQGIMQEVIPDFLRFGFDKLKLKRVTAEVAQENIRSVKLLEKYGFLIRKDGLHPESETCEYILTAETTIY